MLDKADDRRLQAIEDKLQELSTRLFDEEIRGNILEMRLNTSKAELFDTVTMIRADLSTLKDEMTHEPTPAEKPPQNAGNEEFKPYKGQLIPIKGGKMHRHQGTFFVWINKVMINTETQTIFEVVGKAGSFNTITYRYCPEDKILSVKDSEINNNLALTFRVEDVLSAERFVISHLKAHSRIEIEPVHEYLG